MEDKTPCSISLNLILDKKELQSKLKSSVGIGHWNAYSRSEKYLSEQPTNMEIDSAELTKHTKSDDMWIALNHQGKTVVYDITKFAAYHPGGFDILMEYAGTDATEAFRIAHSYVNPSMISRLQKGYLVKSAPGQGHLPNQLSPFSIPSTFRLSNTKKPIWDWKELNSHVELFINYTNRKIFNNFNDELDILRSLSTWTPLDKQKESSGVLMLRTFLDEEYHCLEFSLRNQLYPDLSTLRLNHLNTISFKSSSSSSSSFSAQLKINLIKASSFSLSSPSSPSSLSLQTDMLSSLEIVEPTIKTPLKTIGIVLRDVLVGINEIHSSMCNEVFFTCSITKSYRLENDSRYQFLSIKWPENQVNINIPIGHHVNVRLKDSQGNYVIRPYTPVCEDLTFSTNNNDYQNDDKKLCLLIKIYPDGEFSSLVDKISENDLLDVSLPMGNFNINLIKQIIDANSKSSEEFNNPTSSYLIMLAAGSGITPMLRILHYLFVGNENVNNNQVMRMFKVYLIYFNRSQKDQVLVSTFESLHNRFPDRFFTTHVLSEPSYPSEDENNSNNGNNNWVHGQITDELCRQSLGGEIIKNFDSNVTCLICGPSGFNDAALELTEKWSIPKERVHVFKG
ncbi:unnamed protein product [Heterobilharzia americana]|nr:unnamed protein product [Heterobilharzia americana]